jgi:hypothetical protein
MIGGGLQEKVYGSHKGMTNTSKRMGQSSNGPIKRLGHSNSGIKRLGHTNGSGGGKNNLISEIYPRFKQI